MKIPQSNVPLIFRTTANIVPLKHVFTHDDPFGDFSHLIAVHAGLYSPDSAGVADSPSSQTAYYKVRADGKELIPLTKEQFEKFALANVLNSGTILPVTSHPLSPKP